MPQQFTMRLCQQNLAGVLGFVGIMASLAIGVLAARPLPAGNSQFAVMLIASMVGCYGVYRLVRKVTVREALVTVEPQQLTVLYLTTGRQIQIAFAEVVSYRDELLRDGRELRFRLRSGPKVKLVTNSFLGATGDYDGLLQAVETALATYQIEAMLTHGSTLIKREKSFYERPVATVLLVVTSALMLSVLGDALWRNKPLRGNMITSLGLFISYAGLWYAARQRKAK